MPGARSWHRLETERVAPGRVGTARGSVVLEGSKPSDVRLRLFAGGRVVDERTITVTPVDRPGTGERLREWVIEHAIVLVGALAALVAILAATVATLAVRARRPPASGAATNGRAAVRVGGVDLNSATAEQLAAIRGIGPATAQKIVELRGRNGGVVSLDDLSAIAGIGPKRLEELRQLVES